MRRPAIHLRPRDASTVHPNTEKTTMMRRLVTMIVTSALLAAVAAARTRWMARQHAGAATAG